MEAVDRRGFAPGLPHEEDEQDAQQVEDPDQRHSPAQPQQFAQQASPYDGGEGGADDDEGGQAIHAGTGRRDTQSECLSGVDHRKQ